MALMESWWAPIQRRMDTDAARQGLRRVQAAQNAPYGSLAQQWDPNNYGSVESRDMPGLFGSQGASNPAYQQQIRQQAYQQQLQQKAAMSLQLDAAKRRMAMQNGMGGNYNFMSSLFDDGDNNDGF